MALLSMTLSAKAGIAVAAFAQPRFAGMSAMAALLNTGPIWFCVSSLITNVQRSKLHGCEEGGIGAAISKAACCSSGEILTVLAIRPVCQACLVSCGKGDGLQRQTPTSRTQLRHACSPAGAATPQPPTYTFTSRQHRPAASAECYCRASSTQPHQVSRQLLRSKPGA